MLICIELTDEIGKKFTVLSHSAISYIIISNIIILIHKYIAQIYFTVDLQHYHSMVNDI
jgi:hypothetical protein